MLLIPNGMEDKINDDYYTKVINDEGFPNHLDWFPGMLVHLHLSHHAMPLYENGLKFSESAIMLCFASQDVVEDEEKEIITTHLKADEGWGATHILTHYKGENGFEVQTVFNNTSDKEVTLEMINSASLDGLSPFSYDDGSTSLLYHTFKGGWSIEGKHVCRTLSEMNMEKSWGGSFDCEKIGVIGSKSVGRYYPYAALEDTSIGCTWGIKLKHSSSWQIELSRYGTPLSLSCAIGDYKSGAWCKRVKPGENYTAPIAYVSVAAGGLCEVSNDLLEMNNRDIDAYGEDGMPIIFNDWVTHWGDSSEEKLLSLAKKMQKTKVKYFVADDGWQKGRVAGDWEVDEEKFPNGFKAYTDKIREMGMIPGVWMEFESVREGSKQYAEEYDHLNLTRGGTIIRNAAFNGLSTKFLDMRKPETIEHLDKKLIRFLKDNGIGYLKMDYNASLIGCDDEDSLGQGLIDHMEGLYNFLKRIKAEIPDIIIENCAAGGSRLDPKMMSVTAMSSFSDAHESMEVPVVAANMHYLISPRQSQIWCVLKDEMSRSHIQYVIASGFLGRLCWSGYIDKLSDEQFAMIPEAESFYESVSHIIKHGRSKVYRTQPVNYRALKGTQTVVRYSEDRSEILVVCHFFDEAEKTEINLGGEYEIVNSLYNENCTVNSGVLSIFGHDRSASVLKLKSAKGSI
ncbi:MAG: alpha-galactosidase [Clostridiales bacterium]|nr:alpha-galactosidase [Clostridiales bacterium]